MWLGIFPEDFTTITVPFTTHAQTGAPVAPSSAFETADFKIYKNGSQTEKTSTNGLTIQSPHDSITGVHMLIIDTSNDTGDSGFWEAGALYDVLLSPDETVDSLAVARWVGRFAIAMSGNPRGSVVSDGSNSATSFKISVTGLGTEATDYLKDAYLTFLTGALAGQTKKISGYNATTDFVTVAAFTGTPSASDKFEIVNR